MNLFENLQLMKEVDSTLQKTDNKAIEKTYPSIELNLKSIDGRQELYVNGKDNHKDTANTYLIMTIKTNKNKNKTKTYSHQYLIDSTMIDFEDYLNQLQQVKYINKFFDIINKMNDEGFIKDIKNTKL